MNIKHTAVRSATVDPLASQEVIAYSRDLIADKIIFTRKCWNESRLVSESMSAGLPARSSRDLLRRYESDGH